MKNAGKFLLACALAFLATSVLVHAYALDPAYPGQWLDPMTEYRYIGEPKRDANGKIIRSAEVTAAFQRIHPCPSTGHRAGPCPNWSMDHVVPLACGGIDAVSNLQWLHKSVKSVAGRRGFYPKDRIERKVYGTDPPIPGTNNCTFVTPERTLQ